MADSWIKFNRDIWKNRVVCADAEHFIVWWYLKTKAAFEPRAVMFAGKVITLEPGQLITGADAIAGGTGVERTKVMRVLKHFETAGLLCQQTTKSGRLVTFTESEPQTPRPAKPAGPPRSKKPKEQVYSSDASYDLEAYRRTAIGRKFPPAESS